MINYIDFSNFASSDDETGMPLRSRYCCCSSSVQLLCRHPKPRRELKRSMSIALRVGWKYLDEVGVLGLWLWLWKMDRALPLLLFLSAATSLLHSHSLSFSLYVVEV